MSARSILGMLYTLQALEAKGLHCESALAEHGLSLDNLNPSAFIERHKELAIYQKLFSEQHTGSLGLDVGKAFALAGYGPYGMLLLTARTALAACQMGLKYQQLAYTYGELGFEIGTTHSTLFILPETLPTGIQRFIIDRDLSGMMKMVEDIGQQLGANIDVQAVHLPYPKPDDSDLYQARFGCPVHFEQPRCALITSNALLNRPLPQANELTHQHYQSLCEQAMAEQNRIGASLSHQVHQYISLFTHKFPSIQDVCRHLAMPERTLRRRLSEEGHRFQGLLDDVRLNKAKHWLEQGSLNMETIAQRLGYAEPAAFNHAFKRWTGLSPSSYKKTLN